MPFLALEIEEKIIGKYFYVGACPTKLSIFFGAYSTCKFEFSMFPITIRSKASNSYPTTQDICPVKLAPIKCVIIAI